MVDASGLTDHVRRLSQLIPVPNDRNKTADRPIPSENIVADARHVPLASAPLRRVPITLRPTLPRAPLHHTLARPDERHRKYRRLEGSRVTTRGGPGKVSAKRATVP